MFESCPAQSKLFYTKKFSLKQMKRHIPIAPKPKRKLKYIASAPSPFRKKPKMPQPRKKKSHLLKSIKAKALRSIEKNKEKLSMSLKELKKNKIFSKSKNLKIHKFQIKIKKPTVPKPFEEIKKVVKKDIKKIDSSIKELENKEKLGLRKFTKRIEKWMTKEAEEIKPKVIIEKQHPSIPKPKPVIIPKPHIMKHHEIKINEPKKIGFFSKFKSFEDKEANKVSNALEEIKDHLEEDKKELVRHIKKEVVDLSRVMERKEHNEEREIKDIKGLTIGAKKIAIPKPHMPTKHHKHIHIRPSPIYEVHVIEDLPDPYQLELSRAAKRNKVLKKLIVEEEMLRKRMSQLEETSLVYYKM